jgi:colanic acid/amylovoran biosynthesis glycosyltransferase
MGSQSFNNGTGGQRRLKLAYITDVFPAVSLTFIYLELEKLRQLEMDIDFYAIWKCCEKTQSREAEFLTNETTYLSPPSIAGLLRDHCYYFWHAPDRYLRNLRVCWMRHPTPRLYCRTFYNFFLAPQFARMLQKRGTFHIHAHFAFGAATTAMMAANLLNISFSFTVHGSDVLIEKCLLNEKSKRAKFVVTVSEFNKNRLMVEAPDVNSNKVKVIHCGVDSDVFHPQVHVERGLPVLLAVGSLLDVKGHAYLVEACAALVTDAVDFKCIIVGEGPERKHLEKLILRYKLGEKIKLVGAIPHENIQAYFDRADIVIHPSISEGIPVALMEAMSKGLPVIASRITGIPELVTHEKDGILVSSANVAELAKAMKRLIADNELRTQLGKSAREKILTEFNFERTTCEIKKLFERETQSQ